MSNAQLFRPSLKTRRLTQHFGVEIQEIQLTDVVDRGLADEVRALADRELLLLFRGPVVSEDDFAAFSESLGPLFVPEGNDGDESSFSGHDKRVARLGNVDRDGRQIAADAPQVVVTSYSEAWHTDGSFKPQLDYLTVLNAIEVTTQGGQTSFVSMVAAYEALPEDRKAFIASKRMDHPYPIGELKLDDWKSRDLPLTSHPLVNSLPDGRKALLLSASGGAVHGMSKEDGDALVKELFEFAAQDRFTYTHHWQPGDTLIWNNRGLMHAVHPWNRQGERRLMQRSLACEMPV